MILEEVEGVGGSLKGPAFPQRMGQKLKFWLTIHWQIMINFDLTSGTVVVTGSVLGLNVLKADSMR